MTATTTLFVVIGVIAFSYPLLMRALAIKAQPSRIQLFKLGDKLLESPSLTVAQKKLIESMMDDAFSPRILCAAAVAMPFFIIRRILKVQVGVSFADLTGHLKDQVSEFQGCYLRAVSAANPLCAFIVALEFIVLWLPLRLLGLVGSSRKNNSSVKTVVRSDVHSFVSEIESRHCHA